MTQYLSEADIIKMNVLQIELFSPTEPIGVFDAAALNAAVQQPQQEVFGSKLYPSLTEQAAILGITLIKKHPFRNANKRTAFMAMDVFLRLNHTTLTFNLDEGIEFVVKIATYNATDFDGLKKYVVTELNRHIS